MSNDSDRENEVNQEAYIIDVLFPPKENAYLTDEHYDDENEGDGDLNHIDTYEYRG